MCKNDLVKRETGVNPVRTRHRDKGVRKECVTEKSGRPFRVLIFEPGDLPVVGTRDCYKVISMLRVIGRYVLTDMFPQKIAVRMRFIVVLLLVMK